MFEAYAIFLPGLVHGAENEVYIVSLNPDSTCGYQDGKTHPSWDIGHIPADDILEHKDFDPDVFWGECIPCMGSWYWEEQDPHSDADYTHFYKYAAFIEGRDGDLADAKKFLVDWAENVVNGKPFSCPRAEFVGSVPYTHVSKESCANAEKSVTDLGVDPAIADVVVRQVVLTLFNTDLYEGGAA